MCAAQHFGCPTRLLDWTRSLLIATFFALLDPPPDAPSAAVWCLNLTDFPFSGNLGRQVPKGGHRIENIRKYCGDFQPSWFQPVSENIETIQRRIGQRSPDPTLVVFEAPSVTPRITNQDGLFATYLSFDDYELVWNYSNYVADVESQSGLDLLTKIEVSLSNSLRFRGQLEQDGINLFRLFPDPVGLGLYLKAEHISGFRFYLDDRK